MRNPDDPTLSGAPTLEGSGKGRWDSTGPPEDWDRYQDIVFLGAGGMGRVYRAWDPRLKRLVALKFLKISGPWSGARFLSEARAQAAISHQNVCEIYEVGEVKGRLFIAMQLIEGPTLASDDLELSLKEKVRIIRDVARAIDAAHLKGLIHRDIKPSNIMLENSEEGELLPRVVDFGLSRSLNQEFGGEPELIKDRSSTTFVQTMPGTITGTPAFMAPEQALGLNEKLDERTDVYGIGCTLYVLIAGVPLFMADSRTELLLRVVTELPETLRARGVEIPVDLEAIVMKCLAKEAGQRYRSAGDLADDLDRWLRGDPVEAFSSSPAYRFRKTVWKYWGFSVLAGISFIGALVFSATLIHTRSEVRRRSELALRFGLKVDRVEKDLWKARSLPMHDLRPALENAKVALKAIETEIRRLGDTAEGPGEVALGRGFLALGRYREAREHLLRARASGYEPPEALWAHAMVLSGLYQEALNAADQIRGAEKRKKAILRAEEELRDPALDLLRSLPPDFSEAPEYVEALIARYEGKRQRALKLAKTAITRVAWLYEADVLRGRIYVEMADEEHEAGKYEKETQSLASAHEAFHHAISIAGSDPQAWEGLCMSWFIQWQTENIHQRISNPATLQYLVDSCENGLVVDSQGVGLLEILSRAYSVFADYQVSIHEDPTETIAKSVEASQAVLDIDPANLGALIGMARAMWHEGQYLMVQDRDPMEIFSQAARAAEKAVSISPRSPEAHSTLGVILLDHAVWESGKGRDPGQLFPRSVEAFSTAASLDPESAGYPLNVGIACREWVEFLRHSTGEDPRPILGRARDSLGTAMKINPELWWTYSSMGALDTLEAEFLLAHQQDPRMMVRDAVAAIDRDLELNPKDVRGLVYLGRAWLAGARWEEHNSLPFRESLRRAEAAWQRGFEILPDNGLLEEFRKNLDAADAPGS